MAVGINRVVLIGRLTRDPELRHTPGGTAVCEFSVALNSREKVGEEWQDRADFFDVVAWDKLAEQCAEHLAKGRSVGVDGRLRQERWEKDGQKHTRVKVVASTVQFVDKRADSAAPYEPAAVLPDDDIPF